MQPFANLKIDPAHNGETIPFPEHELCFHEGRRALGEHEIESASGVEPELGGVRVEGKLQPNQGVEPARFFGI